jgi:hypothetical protein
MSSTHKTIQIFLPSGEPHGIRIAEITSRIARIVSIRPLWPALAPVS